MSWVFLIGGGGVYLSFSWVDGYTDDRSVDNHRQSQKLYV